MIKYGFQTYTWQMSYEKYADKIEHVADITKKSGLLGIEAETCMLKGFFDTSSPEAFKKMLAEKGVEFACLVVVRDWLHDGETADEKQLADKAMEFLRAFPNALLSLCPMPQNDRSNLAERQKNALTCVNSIAKRAADFGIKSVFHPNSPPGSVFRTFDDYKLMLDGLDSKFLGFCPDSGHIHNGGMDVYDIFRDYMPLIKHVHFKDVAADGGWKIMGEGITDFVKIVEMLHRSRFEGYVMIEDESPEAEVDPDAVSVKNGEYIRNTLIPIK
jgi:inosose dehydratase